VREEVDILVVGGGPAGLLTAAYLAERHSVALVERGLLGETSKYWVTTMRRLQKHGLAHCVLHRPKSMFVSTFLGGRAETCGDFAVVDDQLMMNVLVERCRRRGVLLTEHCALANLNWTDTMIHVQTTSKAFRARLVVDATGGLSPIAATFRLHKLYGFYLVYGALLRNIALHTGGIAMGHVEHLGDPPLILEVIPCGTDIAYCALFTYSKQLQASQTLEAAFRAHCSHNSFFRTSERTEVVQPKSGAIPIGHLRRRQLRGIVSVGEAGLVQPALLGTAFNEVLEHCQAVCLHITAVLERSGGVPKRPNYKYPLIKRTQDRLQLEMVRAILNGNVEVFDRLVRAMDKLPSDTFYALCSNELTWRQVLQTLTKVPLHFARLR
jgi:2-polyprenyl-6-methoxyphenol hydroxylase-like FAD-dependent oxidoreductase